MTVRGFSVFTMMLTRRLLVFVILSAWPICQSSSAFNRSLCSDASEPSAAGLVVGGRVALRDDWPWLVALTYRKDDEFFCGGSLISERFVLTAAHCLQYKRVQEPMDPKDLYVYLGKFNLTDKTEPNAVQATAEEIIVHSDWNVSDTRWDADIAIVKLSEDVTLSKSIQPVCLWTPQMQPDETNDGGTVVGWGRTENRMKGEHSDVPQEVKILALSILDCYENVALRNVISRRGLCVGGNGSGPCNGDSGGGFFTFKLGKWFLRGIISVSGLNVHKECDVNAPTVSTNVEKFISWMDQVLDGDEQMRCTFKMEEVYMCKLQNAFSRRGTKIFQVSGSHVGGRMNADVRWFWLWRNSKLKLLPFTLGRFFPYLERYQVDESRVEEISRQNFVDLPKLKHLRISSSRLKVIPVDVLYDLGSLITFWLYDNEIEAIDSSTFIHNTKLRYIDLQNNKITSLDSTMFRNNLELEIIDFSNNLITTIGPELLMPLEKLESVNFSNNTCLDVRRSNSLVFSSSEKERIKGIFASQCP